MNVGVGAKHCISVRIVSKSKLALHVAPKTSFPWRKSRRVCSWCASMHEYMHIVMHFTYTHTGTLHIYVRVNV